MSDRLDSLDSSDSLHLGGGQQDFARWSSSEALRAAEWTLARLNELGIETSKSRLEVSRDLLRRTNFIRVQYGFGSSTSMAVAEAVKTTFEMYLIVKNLNQVDMTAARKLKLMLSGELWPVPLENDNGRDAQAELFTGVIFRGAGYRVDIAEPDLVISRRSRKWGVAVKRVKSDRQFRARIRKAQSQLERQGIHGFIVVDPDILLNRLLQGGQDTDAASDVLYARTVEWTRYIDETGPGNRVLALMTLGVGIRPVVSASDFRLEFGVFMQQQYVTEGTSAEIAAIRQIGQDMFASINAALRTGSKPPASQELGL